MQLTKLQPVEQDRFNVLEKACIEGRNVFYIVGMALTEIKQRRFYEAKGFKKFEEYAESIGYTKRHCNQLIIDVDAINSLPPALRELVKSASAARELARIPASLRAAVVEAASEGKKKAATHTAIKKHSPPPPRPKPKAKGSSTPPPRSKASAKGSKQAAATLQAGPKDETGLAIPEECKALWDRGVDAQELLTYMRAVVMKLEQYRNTKDKLFVECDFQGTITHLENAIIDIKRAKPYAICPTCNGKLAEECSTCRERGFVSEFYWKNFVPEETRKLRGVA